MVYLFSGLYSTLKILVNMAITPEETHFFAPHKGAKSSSNSNVPVFSGLLLVFTFRDVLRLPNKNCRNKSLLNTESSQLNPC